jgi:hypothetical protein
MIEPVRSDEAGVFFLAAIAISLATWPISFTLGAYGEVFYNELLTVWVASMAAFLAGMFIGYTQEGEVYLTWWGGVLLSVPTLIMLSAALQIDQIPLALDVLEWLLLLGSLPYIAYIMLSVATPDAMELKSPRLVIGLITCFVVVNVSSFGAGHLNWVFMTCDDFIRAGDEAPESCWSTVAPAAD